MQVFNIGLMDENERQQFKLHMENMLVAQALQQHKEQIQEWPHGKVTGYFLNPDAEELEITYENGKTFHYRNIDAGAEGMQVW